MQRTAIGLGLHGWPDFKRLSIRHLVCERQHCVHCRRRQRRQYPFYDTYTNAAAQTTAGLQKWEFDASTQQWNLAYTLKKGLNLGERYSITDYPTGNNPGTRLPWTPATDGLRNITGIVNGDGTATIYAITSTVSGNGDQGADPNKLVVITDSLDAEGPAPPTGESFTILRSAGNLEVLRGVSFTPGTGK